MYNERDVLEAMEKAGYHVVAAKTFTQSNFRCFLVQAWNTLHDDREIGGQAYVFIHNHTWVDVSEALSEGASPNFVRKPQTGDVFYHRTEAA